jgi:hypothetical protein
MPLTEEQITEIKERLYRYATERDRPGLDWELLGAKIALDAISVIAELRASQAEARRLREALQLHAGRFGGHEAGCSYWAQSTSSSLPSEAQCSGRCRVTRAALAETAPAPAREGT